MQAPLMGNHKRNAFISFSNNRVLRGKICDTGSESRASRFHPGRRLQGGNKPLLSLKELHPDLLSKENAKQFRANIFSIDPQYEPIDQFVAPCRSRMKQTRHCKRVIINFNVHVCP